MPSIVGTLAPPPFARGSLMSPVEEQRPVLRDALESLHKGEYAIDTAVPSEGRNTDSELQHPRRRQSSGP
jgi:hypothetical protein